MTNPTLTLEVRDGTDDSVKESAQIQEADAEQNFPKLGEIRECEIVATRQQWGTIDDALNRRNDWLVVIGPEGDDDVRFRGRLEEVVGQQGSKQITLLGPELDANDAEPTGPNVFYRNVEDSTIVSDIIDGADGLPGIPELETGEIDTVASALSFSASNATPLKALRDVAEATGADLRFNDDKTIDYLDRRGEDKSEDITLRPDNSTVIGEPQVTEDELEDVTHVRGFGAQDGANQIRADGVAPSFEEGDRKTWREYENTDVREESRLQEIVDRQAAEYDENEVQVDIDNLQTPLSNINVGDEITINLPQEGIDMVLRVLKRRDLLTGGAGGLLSLMLSNRVITRDENQNDREKLQRFNRGYQGRINRDNVGQGNWQLVEDANNVRAELPYVYSDDVIDEIDIRLDVRGRAWRSPVNILPHNHNVTIDDHSHSVSISDHSHDVSISDHTHSLIYSVADHSHEVTDTSVVPADNTAQTSSDPLDPDDDTSVDIEDHYHLFTVRNTVTGGLNIEETTEEGGGTTTTTDDGGGTTTTTDDGGGTTETTDETVPAEATVTTEFDGQEFYPEGRIEIDGTTVATGIGDQTGSWDATLDEELFGELSPGKNSIEFVAENDSRGEVMLSLQIETFEEGRTE